MRYFDSQLLANSRPHQQWWGEVCLERENFRVNEERLGQLMVNMGMLANATAILPREAWMELDATTRAVLRADEGRAWMEDLMPLAKAIHIGRLVHMTRMSSDTNNPVNRSMSGQVPNAMDKTVYDYEGSPVPIFSTAFGREWREWNTFQSNNFDALIDDQENTTRKIQRDMALYVLDGDATIKFQGYEGYGIRNHPNTKLINLGTGAGGVNIDLTTATADELDDFFSQDFGAMLDANLITGAVNVYISPEIARAWDKSYSGASGFKDGTIMQYLEKNRRINKIKVSYELSGNEFFGFVPNSQFIRPLVAMAVNTTAKARMNPTDNYQFLVMGALGLEIRGDMNGKSGVFASVVIN
ncbi:putative coat protein [Rhizobium phage RHph_X3_2]|nr:putative coat protein [Rhizobium phage RHph_X3_2]